MAACSGPAGTTAIHCRSGVFVLEAAAVDTHRGGPSPPVLLPAMTIAEAAAPPITMTLVPWALAGAASAGRMRVCNRPQLATQHRDPNDDMSPRSSCSLPRFTAAIEASSRFD
jgi:hypothetical protein